MSDLDQIAAQAAQTIETNDSGNLAYKTAIIKSAIEKATQELDKEMLRLRHLHRAAQASGFHQCPHCGWEWET